MLIESRYVHDLLNATLTSVPRQSHSEEERAHLDPPETYEFSVNPIPALVILLLGIIMSSHHQASMVSTMVHKQWGNLLLGASFARALSYVLVYLRPPNSIFPSRPPTELLASFGLIAGGMIFMASVCASQCAYRDCCIRLLTLTPEFGHCFRDDSLRSQSHVHVHSHYGIGRATHGLGDYSFGN
jgi:hypothetical protein